jgi:hypothetical protein
MRHLVVILSAVFSVVSNLNFARADDTPFIDIYTEVEVTEKFQTMRRHKAFAIGMKNFGYYAEGYETLAIAKREALNGCISYIRKELSVKGETRCKIFFENSRQIQSSSDRPNLRDNVLKQPDMPLIWADIFGSLQDSKAIVLAIHGCDGKSKRSDNWFNDWRAYFNDRNYAVVQPDSLADKHRISCGEFTTNKEVDNILRLRVAQTRRTIGNLKKRFPKKKFYIWGHSQGGLIAQFFDYEVSGIVVTGAECVYASPTARSTPVHMVMGDNDRFIAHAKNGEKLNDKILRESCKGFRTSGRKSYSLIKGGDHWVSVSNPKVQEGLDRIFGKP